MKTKLFLLAILFSIPVIGQIPTINLDSEYKFNGSTLNDTFGTAENLTQTGTASLFSSDRFGNLSNAINLSGDYFQRIPLQNATSISVSFWIKTATNDANSRTIIDHTERTSATNTTSQRGWYVYLRNGVVRFSGNYKYNYQPPGGNTTTGNTGYLDCSSNTNIADNNWHHIVITLKGRVYYWQSSYWMYENEYKVYIDNVLKNTILHNYNTYTPAGGWCSSIDFLPNNGVTIGNNKLGSLTAINKFSDEIDDIRLYKTTLTPVEVTSLFNETAPLSNEDFREFSNFSIYPNPSNNVINIKSDETIESVEIISLEGRKIKSIYASTLDISDLSSGIYLLQVKTMEGKTGIKKIIKN